VIKLTSYGRPSQTLQTTVIGRIVRQSLAARDEDSVLIVECSEDVSFSGYAGILASGALTLSVPGVTDLGNLDHLAEGDVVLLQPTGMVRTLFRRASRHNSIFATDRCNSLCLMCSQPPRHVDDQRLVAQHLRLIRLIDPATRELGITGGEPTLLRDGFLEMIRTARTALPMTALHVLTNGRAFTNATFTSDLAEIGHPDLVLGIPVYSDVAFIHDHVVQARGAFDETMLGIQNLGRFGVNVEVRVVLHRLTYERLVSLAEFLYRNVSFTVHVALMGLEMIGYAVKNQSHLWVDPIRYTEELAAATLYLASRGMNVSIYNHQLCTIPQHIWKYARQSISDWKNEYLPICQQCTVKQQCAGFFASNLHRSALSQAIRPVLADSDEKWQSPLAASVPLWGQTKKDSC
jgi:His-Xaa-Ser system radical SAM maturase HxsC